MQGRVTGSKKISRQTGQRQSSRDRVDPVLPSLSDISTLDIFTAVSLSKSYCRIDRNNVLFLLPTSKIPQDSRKIKFRGLITPSAVASKYPLAKLLVILVTS